MKAKTLSFNSEILALILVAILVLSLLVAMFAPVVIFFTAAVAVAVMLLISYSCK